ncbi:MAG TPA: hypothetical protein VK524_01250, partial [Polyangiaceae bacterium]|nr:hypothetical protein [Polyangiaceae bacterium]
MALFWFHARRQDAVADITTALRSGVVVMPRTDGNTNQLELDLKIFPERLYCCLGRTIERFGSFAFAVVTIPSQGEMSPFDTGGLVHKMPPVSTWASAERQKFLVDYSWPTTSVGSLLATYPGPTTLDIERYLDTDHRPAQHGPHQIWAGKMEADIWANATHWCAWTWEGRFEVTIPVADQLVAWTCTPA